MLYRVSEGSHVVMKSGGELKGARASNREMGNSVECRSAVFNLRLAVAGYPMVRRGLRRLREAVWCQEIIINCESAVGLHGPLPEELVDKPSDEDSIIPLKMGTRDK